MMPPPGPAPAGPRDRLPSATAAAGAAPGASPANLAVAFVALLAMLLLRLALDDVLGPQRPLATLYGAVAVAAWVAGLWPSLLVTVLGYLAASWLFMEPRGVSALGQPVEVVGLAAYLVSCAIIIGFGVTARAALARVQASRSALRRAIGDRRDAEAALRAHDAAVRESEATLRAFYDNSPVSMGVTELTDDGDVLHVYDNHAAARFFGVAPGATHGRRARADLGAAPEVVSRWRAHYLESEASGAPVHFEHMYQSPGGARWLSATVSSIGPGASGRTRFCYVADDVTERRQAEALLRRQATIFAHQSDAIIVADLEGRVLDWNPAAARIFGYGRDEAIGLPITRFLRPEEADRLLREGTDAVLREGEWQAEFAFVRKDGTQGVFEAVVKPLTDEQGRVVGTVGLNRDVTERRRAERELRASEERLAAELAAMSRLHALSSRLLAADDLAGGMGDVLEQAIATCEADSGTLRLVDQRTAALGLVVARGLGDEFVRTFGTLHAADGSVCGRAYATGQHVAVADVRLDPELAPHADAVVASGIRAAHCTPLKDHDGTVVGVLALHFAEPRVVSDRDRRLLDLYARNAADLVERLRYEAALREADRRKDEFLATLAHELRNPLAPIRNAVQVLRAKRIPDEDVAWSQGIIERQLGLMARLLDDLLDVNRISRGKVELQRARVTLAAVVESALETSRPLVEEGRHELVVALPPDPVWLDADPVRLAQVFANLLNNAARYTPEGGRLALEAAIEDGEAVVRVRDSGVGIPRDMLPHVFEMFAQGESARRAHSGLGIGLSLARGLVELHGGRIEARSEGPDRGSEFTVRLPTVVHDAAAAAPPVEVAPAATVQRRRILIVDDLRDGADSLAMLLSLLGHEVRTAYDGEEALATAAAFRPDVLVIDLGMPKLDGYEACRRIRAAPWGAGMSIIALTGWGQEQDRRRTELAGFDHHLVKPADAGDLLRILASLDATGHGRAPDTMH